MQVHGLYWMFYLSLKGLLAAGPPGCPFCSIALACFD